VEQGKFAGQRPTFYHLCHATNHCWVFDSLLTISFPVKSSAVSSLLDYPVVADVLRQNIKTILSSAAKGLFSAALQVLTHADAACLMRQWTS